MFYFYTKLFSLIAGGFYKFLMQIEFEAYLVVFKYLFKKKKCQRKLYTLNN